MRDDPLLPPLPKFPADGSKRRASLDLTAGAASALGASAGCGGGNGSGNGSGGGNGSGAFTGTAGVNVIDEVSSGAAPPTVDAGGGDDTVNTGAGSLT